jgi:hypothetical protein
MLNVKGTVAALMAAAALGTAVAPAMAQTAAVAAQPANAAPATANAPTELQYANADPLHGIYTRKPLIAQCADQTVLGPMPAAASGSLEAQAGYNFLIDPDSVGLACRKPI